ncbi:MAG TPA: 30S ribosomal protein S5 [Candidatus Paceibacterota bacterium]|nr:30S ribosomal protein S5 [Candidatus Paceibacterota bacterium]
MENKEEKKGIQGQDENRAPRGRGGPRRRDGGARPKPEFDQKILDIRRVTRVVAGGRRFSFSVSLVAGDRKGSVGLGLGKAGDTALAINKALRNAKKNMVTLKLTESSSIPFELSAKFGSASVMMMPNKGRGLVAGTVIRDIAKLAGIKDITSKVFSGTKNKLNNTKAVMKALEPLSSKYTKVIDKAEPKEGGPGNREAAPAREDRVPASKVAKE